VLTTVNCSNTVKLEQNFWNFRVSGNSGVSSRENLNCSNAVAVVGKPLFKRLFNLSESRIFLNSCWVEVLKNLEHLGKLVLKEAPLAHT